MLQIRFSNDEEKLISKMKRGSERLGREFFRCIAVSDGFFLILSKKSEPRSSFWSFINYHFIKTNI